MIYSYLKCLYIHLLDNLNLNKTRASSHNRSKNCKKEKIYQSASLRHGRIPRAYCIRAISIYFPLCLSRTQQCCRFRKCSVAILKCFNAFTRACSGNWAEHPLPSIRGDASTPSSSLIVSPHRTYLSRIFPLFIRLLTRCLSRHLPLSDLYLTLLPNFSPLFLLSPYYEKE